MEYSYVAEAISASSCAECRACFPQLANFCDVNHILGTCEDVIEKYLRLQVERNKK